MSCVMAAVREITGNCAHVREDKKNVYWASS